MFGQMMTQAPCERCQGHGTVIDNPCPVCSGHGRIHTVRTVGVNIPAGITDDARIRLGNQGEVGEGGGTAGDLYIDIHVAKNPTFTRDGDNLHCWISIPMTWAVLGHRVDINTFDGKQSLDIPAGSQPDDVLTVKGLGVTRLRQPSERGDLLAHVGVSIPRKLSDDQRSLIEQLEQSRPAGHEDIMQSAEPTEHGKKGFFSKLKDALS